jgi:flagellar motility protein MotE (MotC chaperone)
MASRLQQYRSRRNVVPSLATSLWLLFAAATQPDPLSPPPHGREADVPALPAKPAVASTKAPPSVAKPNDPTAPTSPKSPKAASAPVPANPTATASQPGKTAKIPPRIETPPANVEEPEEEIVADPSGKLKARKKGSRKVATTVDRAEVPERKSPWSADRYAAVVPPGLTLAALRSQLAKGGAPVAEPSAPAAEHSRPMQTVSDIDKAREALRQETARLETLLKAAGDCGGGGGGGMTTGEPLLPTTPVSASALREAASEQIDSVSKAVKGMKPEQAAAVVARLDRGLAAEILRRMKSTDAGAILGLLKPDLAAELATEIATRKPTYPKDKKGSAK